MEKKMSLSRIAAELSSTAPMVAVPFEPAVETLDEYSKITTIHGLKQCFAVGMIRKLAWIILLIACSVMLVIQVRMKIVAYRQNSIVTNIEYTYPTRNHFPAIMLCNDNLFKISYTKDNLYYLISEIYQKGGTGKLNMNVNFTSYKQAFENAVHNNSLDFLKYASSQMSDMLISCAKPNEEACDTSDFETIPTSFGICYAINTDVYKPMVVDSEGFGNGLYLLINIETYERMPGSMNTLGLKVIIYNQTTYPLATLEGIHVAPGFETSIGLTFTTRTKIPIEEGGSCVTDGPMAYIDSDFYTINRCKASLQIEQVINSCGCRPFFAQRKKTLDSSETLLPICDVQEHFECVVFAKGMPVNASTCRDNCTSTTYNTFLSTTKLPKDYLKETIGRKETSKLYDKFLSANEVRQRVELDRMEINARLIRRMRTAASRLKRLHMAPVLDNYMPTYERLELEVPCFNAFNSNYGNTVMSNGVWADIQDPFHKLLNQEKILSIIHPQIPVESLIINMANLTRTHEVEILSYRAELRLVFNAFNNLLGPFRPEHYFSELGSDITDYGIIFNLIDRFEWGNITKRQWATETLALRSMYAEYTGSLLSAIEANAVHKIQLLLKGPSFENASRILAQMLSDPILRALTDEKLFQDYVNETCVDEYTVLADKLYQKYKDMVPYPDLLDNTARITQLCRAIPQENLDYLVRDLSNCLTGPVFNKSNEILDLVNEASDILSQPFEELTKDLVAYDWFMDQGTTFYQDNILAINIFFQDLSIEVVTQEKSYDIWSLFCDIGGTLGLFLGASIVTLFEMFDFFVLRPLCRVMATQEKTTEANHNHAQGMHDPHNNIPLSDIAVMY